MKILIFGNSGFIGKEIEKFLINLGHLVIGVSRSGKSEYNFDISNFANFKQITEVPDIIINSASILPANNKDSFEANYLKKIFEVNLIGGVNIVKWAQEKGIKKIINLSSLSINKKPWNVPLLEGNSNLVTGYHTGYAMSKLCQEKMMTEVDVNGDISIIHLRLSAVYGCEMKKVGVIFFLQEFLNNKKNIEITNGVKTSFDFIHVKDISSVIAQLLYVDIPGGIYNLGSEEEIKLIDLAKILIRINGGEQQVINHETEREISRSVVSCNKIKVYLGEREDFIPLEEGLKSLVLS